MKKSKTLLAMMTTGLLLTSMALSGCGAGNQSSTFSPKESRIYVARDGGISSSLVETYDKDIYVQSELEAFAQEAAAEFSEANVTQEKAAVTLKSCTMEDGMAKLIFEYNSGESLTEFAKVYGDTANQVESLTVTTVADGLVQGLIVDTAFLKAKDGSAVDNQTVTKDGGFHLVAVKGPSVTLQTEGKVRYYSTGSTLVDEFTVKTSEGNAYIIFK